MTLPYAPAAGYVPVSIGSGTVYTAQTPPSGPPSGAAGGSLGGTYPNPTVINLNFLTTRGDLAYRNATTATRLALGTTGAFLYSDGTDAVWFAMGTALQVLRVNAGGTALEWATISSAPSGPAGGDLAGTYPNPTVGNLSFLTTRGDLVVRNATTATRLALGGAGAMFVSDGTDAKWLALGAAGSLMYSDGAAGIWLPRGTALQILRVNAAATGLEWAAPSVTASQISDATASARTALQGMTTAGAALSTAADAAAQRTALGVTQSGGGLYSALPPSPALGDVYTVSDLDPTYPGAVFVCRTATLWTYLVRPRTPTQSALHHWRLDQTGTLTDVGSDPVAMTVIGSSWVRNEGLVYLPYGGIMQTAPGVGDRLSAAISIAADSNMTIAISLASVTGAAPSGAAAWVFGAWNGGGTNNFFGFVMQGGGNIYLAASSAGSGADSPAYAPNWARATRYVATFAASGGLADFYANNVFVGSANIGGGATRAAIVEAMIGGIAGNALGIGSEIMIHGDAILDNTTWDATKRANDWEAARRTLYT